MKYLLYMGAGIGDFALILPMARRIKLFDKNAYITAFSRCDSKRFLVSEQLFVLQEWIDKIGYYSVEEPFHNIKFLYDLGLEKYDYGIRISYVDNKYVSKWPNVIMRIMAKRSVGMNLKYKPNFKYDYAIDFLPQGNFYQQSLDLLSTLGISRCCNEADYPCFNAEKLNFSAKILNLIDDEKNIIVIIPGTMNISVTADGKSDTKPAKKWPYKNWLTLCSLLDSQGYNVVILGGRKEYNEIKEITHINDANIINLCGKTSIAESISIVSKAKIVVGCDTGLMHCAGILGTTSLTLFGCTSYKNYLSLSPKAYYIQADEKCSPCFGTDRLAHCSDFHCMKKISVEEVYNKIISILGADSGN